ncbi:Rhodanese-related sulfurtransferase [Chitinasiproducens palmae]|uniref:Rhodanese-related sulfurtransferase n=2 Tax=Chitinasiproducens palmae TaxID=1770053 RepID=A0A1H2PM32_9BURK|nr:Rhodanese-related sulfurtransferase [Chitinasiproducens palmae]
MAASLPYSRLELDAPWLLPARDVPIALLDDNDGVAERAARRLATLGYHAVAIVDEGVVGASQAGLTLFEGVNVPSKTFGEWIHHRCRTPQITATALRARLDAGERMLLLDGRTPEEYRRMTIPGARCCPNGELAYRIDELVDDEETPIVVNCAGRTRSIIGAQTLIDLGIPNPVLALENGTQGWFLADFALEHGADRFYPSRVDADSQRKAQIRAQRLGRHHGVQAVDATTVSRWLSGAYAATYVFDVRTIEEHRHDNIGVARHAPGGQLLQNTDQYVAIRGARIVVVDDDGSRATVIAAWLRQMGHDAFTMACEQARRIVGPALPPDGSAPFVLGSVLPSALRQRDRASAATHLVDLRSSSAWLSAHVKGAFWSIRPRLVAALQARGATLGDRIALISDDADVARLAARDLLDTGYADIVHVCHDPARWREAGFQIAEGTGELAQAARIDYVFFAHDRHAGNRDAARAYLAWEQDLVAQCSALEIGAFERADL